MILIIFLFSSFFASVTGLNAEEASVLPKIIASPVYIRSGSAIRVMFASNTPTLYKIGLAWKIEREPRFLFHVAWNGRFNQLQRIRKYACICDKPGARELRLGYILEFYLPASATMVFGADRLLGRNVQGEKPKDFFLWVEAEGKPIIDMRYRLLDGFIFPVTPPPRAIDVLA